MLFAGRAKHNLNLKDLLEHWLRRGLRSDLRCHPQSSIPRVQLGLSHRS
jgi:hypothetical protein